MSDDFSRPHHDDPDVLFRKPHDLIIKGGNFELAQNNHGQSGNTTPHLQGAEGSLRPKVMFDEGVGMVIQEGKFIMAKNIYHSDREEPVGQRNDLTFSPRFERSPLTSRAPYDAAGVDSAGTIAFAWLAEQRSMDSPFSFVKPLKNIPLNTLATLVPDILAKFPDSALIDYILANLPVSRIASLPRKVAQTLPPHVPEVISESSLEKPPVAHHQIFCGLALMVSIGAIIYTASHLLLQLF